MDRATLQARLALLGGGDPLAASDVTLVALPSLEVDRHVLERHVGVLSACEERSLYQLLLLRRPDLRIVFVSSEPVPEDLIDHYLRLIPGVSPAAAARRVTLISPEDATPRPLGEKLLDRPDLIAELRLAIGDPHRAFMAPYSVTEVELDLAAALGIPIYGPDPRHAVWGTKSGARWLFAQEGIPHPVGVEGMRDAADVAEAAATVRAMRPDAPAVVVKLDEGIYGEGNRVLALTRLPPPGGPTERRELRRRVEALGEEYLAEVLEGGAVVEELVVAEELRSPSGQVRVRADGATCEVSTHEQILGGDTGQTFVGCRFPAFGGYAAQIAAHTEAIARRLGREGVMGRLGVDFVAGRRPDGRWAAHAIEINLRDGGTTHSFGALRLLTGGDYDSQQAVFRTAAGEERCYRASDDLEDPAWVGLRFDELHAAAVLAGVGWDPAAQTGTVFHMMRSLPTEGRIGATSIGLSPEHADALYERTVALLHRLAARQPTVLGA
ncbi:MAG TPA: peptide ligase PGM1-related protein [Solirubrobacteraceae bacterium]|nr:peptide ligase PGM1-related protein [Solirubrobacteraceae bacterium]